jgi:fructokinase
VGLPKVLIAVDAHAPTGTVSVDVGADGQPHYTIHENVAWDAITASASARAVAMTADAICFGSLAQRAPVSRAAIRELIATPPLDALRVFDINLRQSFYSREIIEDSLTLANVLKLNDAELPVLAGMFGLTGDALEQMAELARRFELRAIALTRGGAGSVLFHDHDCSQHSGIVADVSDTIGAGDAFTAAFVLGLLHRWPLAQIDCRANEVAAFVCSQRGATPPLPNELRAHFTSAAQPA